MEEEFDQALNGVKFQWNLNATEFIPLSFMQPLEFSRVPEAIEDNKSLPQRRKKVQKQERKIQNNSLSELPAEKEGRRRTKKERTIKQEGIQDKPKRIKAKVIKIAKRRIYSEEVKEDLAESDPSFIESAPLPTFSYKAAILTSQQRVTNLTKPDIEETVSSVNIPSSQTEKQPFSLPNRISKVSDNVIEKNKQRWIEISDQIIKQGKSAESNTPQTPETRQNHIWHDILRTGLPPVTNDQLATHSSSTAQSSSISGSSSYSHNIIIVSSISTSSSSSSSSGLSKTVVDQLLERLSWWQIILYGAKDLILPALNLKSSLWQTTFRSSKLKKEEIEVIPSFLLELCEGLTCLHILCLLSPQHYQHIAIDQTTLALVGKDRLFRFNDCLDLLLQSSFAIQDAINLADNSEKKAPLHYLCQFNTPECLCVITSPAIRPSLQVNAKDKDGNTPLHLLLIHQNYSLLPAFLETLAISPRKVSAIVGMVGNRSGGSGCKDLALKINQRNKEGAPPILYCNHRTSLQLLLKYGATPFLCDNHGYDSIHRMIERSEYGLVKTLLHFNYTPRQLQTSPFYQQQQHTSQTTSTPSNTTNSSTSSSMSTSNCNMFSEGWVGRGSGTTPFHLAIESGNAKILNLLLQSIDLSQTNCYFYDYLVFYLNRQDETYGLTAIQYAAMKGNAQAFFAFFFHPLCDVGRTILPTNTLVNINNSDNTSEPEALPFSLYKLQNEIGLLCYFKYYDILIRVVRLVNQYYFYDLYLLRAQQEEEEEKQQEKYNEEDDVEGEASKGNVMQKKKINKMKEEKNDRFAQRRRSMLLLSQSSSTSSTSSYLLILQKLIASEEKGEKNDVMDDSEEVEKVVLMMPKRNYLALFTLTSSTLASDPFVSCSPFSRFNLLNQVTDVICQTILKERNSRYYLPPPSTRLQREGTLINAETFVEKVRKVSMLYEDYSKGFLAMVLGGVSMSYDFIRFFLLTGNIISEDDDDVRLERIVAMNKNDHDINAVVLKEGLIRYEEEIKGRLLTWKLFKRYGLVDEDTSIINDFSFFYGNNPMKKNSNNNMRIEENKKEKEINKEEGYDYWSNDWKFIHLFPKVKLPLIINSPHKQYTTTNNNNNNNNNNNISPFPSPSPLSTVRLLLAEGEEVTLPLHLLLTQSMRVQHIYHQHLTSNPLNSHNIVLHLPHYTKETLTFLLPYLQYRENVFFKKLRTISNLDEEQVRHVIYLLGNILQFSKELLINELELMTFHFIINAFFQYSIIFDDIRAKQLILIYAKTNDINELQDRWIELLQFLCNEEMEKDVERGEIMKSGYYSFSVKDEVSGVSDAFTDNNGCLEFFWFSYQDILKLFLKIQSAQKSQTPFIQQKINIIQTDNCLTNWINFIEDPNLLNIKSDYIHWDVTILPKSLSSDHNYFRMNIIIQSLSYHHLLEVFTHFTSLETVSLPAFYSLLQGGEYDRLQRWLKMHKSTLDAESRLKSRQKLSSFCKYLYQPSSETIQEQFGVVIDSHYKSWINVTKIQQDGLDKNVATLSSNHCHYYYVTNPQSVSLFPLSDTSSCQASAITTPTTSFTASSLLLEMVTNIRHFLIDMTFLARSYQHSRRQTADLLLILHPNSDHKESRIYEVHKEIMFHHSEKIQAMTSFQSDQQERNRQILATTSYSSSSIIPGASMTVLSIEENVKEEVMSAAIYYCYHNFLPLHLFEEENEGAEDDVTLLLDLAIFASDYLMSSLLHHVTLLLLRKMNNGNSSDIYQTAKHYHLYELEKVSALYLLKLYSLSLIPIAQMIQIQEDDLDEEEVTEVDESRKDGLKKKNNNSKEEKIYNYLLTTMMSSIFSY